MSSRRRVNKHQSLFNDEIKDRIDTASSLVAKVTSSNQQDTETLQKVVEELQKVQRHWIFGKN